MAGDRTDIRKPSEDTRLNVRSGGIEIRRKGKPVRGAVSGADGVVYLAIDKLGAQAGPRAIVVVTDGLPNNREEALAVAQEAKNGGIDIITIGTEDADKAFLAKLATRSGLSVVVSDEDLGRGIASTAKMLPGLGSGQQVSGR